MMLLHKIIRRRAGGAPLPLAGGVGGGLSQQGQQCEAGTSPPSVPPASGREARAAFLKLISYILIFLFLSTPAHAKDAAPHLLGTFGKWRTYKTNTNDPVCYMTLMAHFAAPAKGHRGDSLLTITHRPREASKDVFSYTAGYNYKPMSDASLHIGKQSFDLFTSQDTAWSRDAATDHKIAAALRSATSLTITGTPTGKKKMALVTDRLFLKGAAEAYQAIGKACGIVSAQTKPTKAAKSARHK